MSAPNETDPGARTPAPTADRGDIVPTTVAVVTVTCGFRRAHGLRHRGRGAKPAIPCTGQGAESPLAGGATGRRRCSTDLSTPRRGARNRHQPAAGAWRGAASKFSTAWPGSALREDLTGGRGRRGACATRGDACAGAVPPGAVAPGSPGGETNAAARARRTYGRRTPTRATELGDLRPWQDARTAPAPHAARRGARAELRSARSNCSTAGAPRRPSGVRKTRHDSPIGTGFCANGWLPSIRVGDPRNQRRSADSGDTTSTSSTSSSTPPSGTA